MLKQKKVVCRQWFRNMKGPSFSHSGNAELSASINIVDIVLVKSIISILLVSKIIPKI